MVTVNGLEKTKLLGEYHPPKVGADGFMICERLGKVEVDGFTNAFIPWPVVKRGGTPSIVLCGDLIEAVRRESVSAIVHWWGVSANTVRIWRRVLGVPRMTEGTTRLHREAIPDRFDEQTKEKARKAIQSPETRAKMSASRKGKQVHPNTRKAALAASKRPKSDDWKAKMSERLRREWKDGVRVSHNQWTPEEIALLGTDVDRVIAEQIGRSVECVGVFRRKLGVPPFNTQKIHKA
jgi:hypothetical protein